MSDRSRRRAQPQQPYDDSPEERWKPGDNSLNRTPAQQARLRRQANRVNRENWRKHGMRADADGAEDDSPLAGPLTGVSPAQNDPATANNETVSERYHAGAGFAPQTSRSRAHPTKTLFWTSEPDGSSDESKTLPAISSATASGGPAMLWDQNGTIRRPSRRRAQPTRTLRPAINHMPSRMLFEANGAPRKMTLTMTSPFAPPQTFSVDEGSSTFVKMTDWNGNAEMFVVSVDQGSRCAPGPDRRRMAPSQEVSPRTSYGPAGAALEAMDHALVGLRDKILPTASRERNRVADVPGKSGPLRGPDSGKGKVKVDRAQRAESDAGLHKPQPSDLSDADTPTIRTPLKQKTRPEVVFDSNEDPFAAPTTRSAAKKTPAAARNTPQPAKSSTPRRKSAKNIAKIDNYDKHSGQFLVKWKRGASRQDCWMHKDGLPQEMVAQYFYENLHADVSEDAGVAAEEMGSGDEDGATGEEIEEGEDDDEDEDEGPTITPRGRKRKNLRTSMGSP